MKTLEDGRAFITRVHKLCQAIRDCPVPVICRMEGYTLGAGLEVAAACDMRIAADNAFFGMPEVKVGVAVGGRGGAAAAPDRLGPHLVAAADGGEHRRRHGGPLGPGRAGRAGGQDRRGGRALRCIDRRGDAQGGAGAEAADAALRSGCRSTRQCRPASTPSPSRSPTREHLERMGAFVNRKRK